MSIVNFSIQADRVLVAVDTLGGTKNQHVPISKMFPIPHAGMLVCGRGSAGLIARAALLCGFMPGGIDVVKVELLKALPGMVWRLAAAAAVCGMPMEVFRAGHEVYVFGYSASAAEMIALRFFKSSPRSKWLVEDDLVESIAPGLRDDDFPQMFNVEDMRRIAQKQVRQCAKDSPGAPIGGGLVFAELTRHRVSIQHLADINAPLTGSLLCFADGRRRRYGQS